MPTGALAHGEEGPFGVWHHAPTGRVLYVFADEFLAQRFAVSVGSTIHAHSVRF
jgi:hypothetical protein